MSGERINGECLSFPLALVTVSSHGAQPLRWSQSLRSLKRPRACVCVHVCWAMRTGCGSPPTGVAASAGGWHKLTPNTRWVVHGVDAHTWSSFPNGMCHLHVISNRLKANKHRRIENQVQLAASWKTLLVRRKIFLKDWFYIKFLWLAPNICFWLCLLVLYELYLTVFRDSCDKCCVPTVIYGQ